MPLSSSAANKTAGELLKDGRAEWARLRRFVRYARGRHKRPWLPDNAEIEYRDIAEKSASNWIDLVIRATAQGLHVDGYGDTGETPDGDNEAADVWRDGWQANGMDARQHSLHRAVLTCGYGFLFVFPGADDGTVWIRPDAATKVIAQFEDPSDEWPVLALREIAKDRYELYDAEARYLFGGAPGNGTDVTITTHDLQVCPTVRMNAGLDLLGTPMGEVEPIIPIQDRIVDATFTLQMAAKYGAFPQRWIAGLDISKPLTDADGNTLLDAQGNPVFPTIKAYIDHILTAVDPETKFGQFQAADLKQYVEALEAHIRHLAAITQTPPHYLLGSLVNLSAEALAAAESGLQRKIREKREVLGEGYEQALRLAAQVLGDEAAAQDTSSQVHWQDVESRSLAQTADAIMKLKAIGVPPLMLFEMIPGWTKADAKRASDMLLEGDPLTEILKEFEAANTPPAGV